MTSHPEDLPIDVEIYCPIGHGERVRAVLGLDMQLHPSTMLLHNDAVSIELVHKHFENGFTWTYEHDDIVNQFGMNRQIFGVHISRRSLRHYGMSPDDAAHLLER